MVINRAGHQFLAGATFPGDKRGCIGAGKLANGLEHLLHGGAAANDAKVIILTLQQRLIGDLLLHVAGGLERAIDNGLKLGHVEGL